jgi:hypothetical protein
MARNKHGGKREGSGRPKVGKARVLIVLTDEQAKWLEAQCQNQAVNKSEFIRHLIEKARLNNEK